MHGSHLDSSSSACRQNALGLLKKRRVMIKEDGLFSRLRKEAAEARISFVLDLRIRYVWETRPVKEMVDVARKAEQHVVRAMLAHVSSVPSSG
ncbi:hypothetical protein BVRB_7g179480 [Beta vulgaris subsp. vulgaris]|uniref:Uncharacterized protein n=1 Tax=Beta vulgaris subsp. vulgaris TaxID=3555 RepID=A0A0J8B6Z3_BETVV|nr:hypothetical protein BVRB_7g179480 [Beta vulgaris subsp. vulgaris]